MSVSSWLQQKVPRRFVDFFSEQKSVLGLDIGTSSVKLIQLRAEKERAVLETYGEITIGPYMQSEAGRISHVVEEKMSEIVHDVWKETGAHAKNAIVGIPLRNSFVTFIDLPQMSEKDLREAVPFEARKYIPLPLSEVEIDWWRIPYLTDEEGEGLESMTILIAAVQKETILKYQRILKGAGLNPRGFEVEIFSVARSTVSRFRSPVVVMDWGALDTKVAIIDRGTLRMSHVIVQGSQALSLAVSHALGIDFARAEEIKRAGGILKRPETEGTRHTLLPLIDSILDEAHRLTTTFQRRHGRTVDKVILAGSGALLPGLAEYTIERFGIEVLLADSFERVAYPSILSPTIKQIAPTFAQAVGLALRGIP